MTAQPNFAHAFAHAADSEQLPVEPAADLPPPADECPAPRRRLAGRLAHMRASIAGKVRVFAISFTLILMLLGLLLGLIGTDVNSGAARFSFDIPELTDGIGFVAIAMGVFGYGEIIANLSRPDEEREVFTAKVKGLFPTKEDFKRMVPAVLRGTALGSALGILPGGGALLADRRCAVGDGG